MHLQSRIPCLATTTESDHNPAGWETPCARTRASVKRSADSALTFLLYRLLQLIERVFADGTLLADRLDVKEMSISLKADFS